MHRLFYFSLVIFGLIGFRAETGADPKKWEQDIANFEMQDSLAEQQSGAIVFVGSSSIRMWRTLPRDMAPLTVINRGFGGSTLADCVHFAQRIVNRYQPAAVVLYAGDNDIAAGSAPEQVLADFKRFVATVRRDLPNSAIFFVSIKPSPARWDLWEKMRKANGLVDQFVKAQKSLGYIDVATPMLDRSGRVRADLFLPDRLHMNSQGYNIWASVMKPRLMEFKNAVGGRVRNDDNGE
ncbi:MAG: SGNH/GDSL hydrolase family protein [Candidatus Latescibacterota bacterium]